jgi:TPR repeat protein
LGNEVARNNIGIMEFESENMERAAKQWKIAASAGNHKAMYNLLKISERGNVSRDAMTQL